MRGLLTTTAVIIFLFSISPPFIDTASASPDWLRKLGQVLTRNRVCSWLFSSGPRNLNVSRQAIGPRPDFYLLNPPVQPKAEIAEYVSRFGIRVPRRFPTLRAAIKSKRPFILRSEHPEEYSSAAGVFESYAVDAELQERLKRRVSRGWDYDWKKDWGYRYSFFPIFYRRFILGMDSEQQFLGNILRLSMETRGNQYAKALGIDPREFSSKASFSYWELLGGYNRTIVADTAISGRYHIVTKFPTEQQRRDDLNYTVVENGQILFSYPDNLPDEMKAQVGAVVRFYESIRQLPRFNSLHCPLVEFQTIGSKNYFLQYHRTQDFNQNAFTLNREMEPGEVQVEFVRGATPPEGLILESAIRKPLDEVSVSDAEEAAWEPDAGINGAYLEIMSRRRQVQFIDMTLPALGGDLRGHISLSRIFNPGITAVVPREKLASSEQWKQWKRFKFRIISDGRKAYVKVLEGYL